MLKKLHDQYPGSLLENEKPDFSFYSDMYWLHHEDSGQWLGIPSQEVSADSLMVLKTLFEFHDCSIHHAPASQAWFQYLFSNGEIPSLAKDVPYRLVQFKMSEGDWIREDMEAAFKGFFEKDILILWNGPARGVIVEEANTPLAEEEFLAISNAFESDFFVKTAFYIGIPNRFEAHLRNYFKEEQRFFEQASSLLPAEKVLKYETLFPSLVTGSMDAILKKSLLSRLSLLQEDSELLHTIKVFLQNSSNVSLTAKKLYVHRNTLQYRLDKFTEKTGLQLKDFNSALTVYLACLLVEQK
ncbi:PucR family transcriptional regulator [Cytobacillus oceanisediminis]|uniref:PucR family transcriptional regulator n=1 Tax=Cytobacillus oceanisediminis TaxID=665099 RepID=UPI001C249CE3|nr:helix-turn-helix domain-containing protein [Cytobacillus oceanisediminis]MBU8768003.1 helix-turn-helix domain-containing protein [Cytobacillus oceanisediminis]